MLLKSYTKKISRPECKPGFQSVHCIAHPDQVSEGWTSRGKKDMKPIRMAGKANNEIS